MQIGYRILIQGVSRGNTILTKTMESFMAIHGASFLEASLGSVLQRIRHDKVAIEKDAIRGGKSSKYTERNIETLVYWCQELWNSILNARGQCPP